MKTNYALVPRLLQQNKRLAFVMASAFLRQLKAKVIDYNFKKDVSSEMPLVTLKITPLCNLRCVMCGQRGIKGTLKGQDAVEKAKDNVTTEQYKKFVDEVSTKAKLFYVWGGEPFMYPGFMDLMEYMVKKIPAVTVNTNGTFLAQNAERIVRDKWAAIFVSLDAFEDVNDEIRGKGSYKKVIEGIKAVNEEKRKQGSHLPNVGIVTTVSNLNYLDLANLVRATKDLELAWHIINLGTYFNEEIGAEHVKAVKAKLGVEPTFWRGFVTGLNEGIDGEKFSKILEDVHAASKEVKHPIITVPVITPSVIGTYYNKLDVAVRDHCKVPWFMVNVDYNGDVHFCADHPDYVVGNIKETGIHEIYNGERARKFRNALRTSPDGIFPGCKRCYQVMLCGRRRKGF
jgi:radical SAM protein with 4Fe4S-binding SPASM domain